jgi:hypothetical protein
MSAPIATIDQRMALRALANGKAPPAPNGNLFVGRHAELSLFDRDLDLVAEGGASLRILVGEPGSGKTMLQQAMASRARGRGFVTMSADLSPDRLLHGRGGEGRGLLRDAILGMETAASSEGLALDTIVGRFGNNCAAEAEEARQPHRNFLRAKLAELHSKPKGAEFAKVVETLALAPENSSLSANARRWLCGGYSSNSEARDELGIGGIVEDQDFWLMARNWASFLRLAGRPGLVLFLDEAQVLCNLHNANARALNLEQLLMVLNDVLQGRAPGIAMVIAATPAFVTQWNGLARHDGLSSCLLSQGDQDISDPANENVLLHLQDLEVAELVELLGRCRQLYSACHPEARLLPDEGLEGFLESCRNQIGEARWQVPRRILQRFISFHQRLAANPTLDWPDLLSGDGSDTDDIERAFDGYACRQM